MAISWGDSTPISYRDYGRAEIYLPNGGASYAFHLQFSQQGASTIFTLDYEDTDYAKNDTQPQVLTVDRGSANELISPFQSGDVILLTWDDARSLTQIKREIAADPERVLNKNYETMVAQRVQRLSVEGQ